MKAAGVAVGMTTPLTTPLSAALSPLTGESHLRLSNQNFSADLRLDIQVRVDIRENLYDGWTQISRPYGMQGEDQLVLPGRPNCPPNLTTYYGQAFGREPATGSFPGQGAITGFEGRRFVNSKNRNLGTFIGELQSDPFEIKGDRISFLIGGGDFEGQTCLNLFVEVAPLNFRKVRTATGNRNLQLIRKQWDVTAWKGKRAYLQILDYAPVERWGRHAAVSFPEDDYGFILIDDIQQTDAQGNRVSEANDRKHNFDFERVKPAEYELQPTSAIISLNAAQNQVLRFSVTRKGQYHGEF